MFHARHAERSNKLAKAIIDHYGHTFFYGKTVLDLGSGSGDIAAALARLGANVLCCDVRLVNLQFINKHHPYLKTQLVNLETDWPFTSKFDIVLSLGVVCHLKSYEDHIKNICNIGDNIVLESEIYDSVSTKKMAIYEEKSIPHLSFSGEGSLLSANYFQEQFALLGSAFKRVDDAKLNTRDHRYDWRDSNSGHRASANRRMWFIKKASYIEPKIDSYEKIFEESSRTAETNIFSKKSITSKSAILPEHEKYFTHVPKISHDIDNSIIRLFYIYNNNDITIKKETDFCFQNNLNNKLFNTIFINENIPTYNFLFNKINEMTGPNDINIICNSDIFFDETIELSRNIKHRQLYALTSWEWFSSDNIIFNNIPNSQDAWIVRGKIENIYGDFPMSGPECDTKIAYEFHKSGYKTFNPSKSIKANRLCAPNMGYKITQKPITGPHLFIIPASFSNE